MEIGKILMEGNNCLFCQIRQRLKLTGCSPCMQCSSNYILPIEGEKITPGKIYMGGNNFWSKPSTSRMDSMSSVPSSSRLASPIHEKETGTAFIGENNSCSSMPSSSKIDSFSLKPSSFKISNVKFTGSIFTGGRFCFSSMPSTSKIDSSSSMTSSSKFSSSIHGKTFTGENNSMLLSSEVTNSAYEEKINAGNPNKRRLDDPDYIINKKARFSRECCICLEDLAFENPAPDKEVMSTLCGHVFCKSCIVPVLEKYEACPTCLRAQVPSNLHPLYL